MDDVLLNKANTLENCIKRIHEEYIGHENELASNVCGISMEYDIEILSAKVSAGPWQLLILDYYLFH